MKKMFSLLAVILFSALAVAAQSSSNRETQKVDGNSQDGPVLVVKSIRERSDRRVLRVGPSTTYLRQGLSIVDVVKVLGKPDTVVETQDGDLHRVTYTFPRSEGHVLVVEFENGVLVRSRIETNELVAQNKLNAE